MNQDVLTSIMLNLNIKDLIQLCQTNQCYFNLCSNFKFWQLYFNNHNKIIPYQPKNLRDWFLLYEYNEYIPLLKFQKVTNWQLAFETINQIITKAFDLINHDRSDILTIPKNSNFIKMVEYFNNVDYSRFIEPVDVVFYPEGITLFFTEDGYRVNDFIQLSKKEMIMYAVILLMENNVKNEELSCIII